MLNGKDLGTEIQLNNCTPKYDDVQTSVFFFF